MKSVEEIIEDIRKKLIGSSCDLLLIDRDDAKELVRYFDDIDQFKKDLSR